MCRTSDRVRAAEIPAPGGDRSPDGDQQVGIHLRAGADCCIRNRLIPGGIGESIEA